MWIALIAALLSLSVMRSSAATPVNFSAGSLIIPMDTDTSGNHASYNQNLGMWKAYGLLYRLLANGVPVRWAISSTKTSTSDIDFSVTSVNDKRTGTALGQWDYRGGAFIVESQYVAQALPIIQAFWAAQGNQPNVHEAQVPFTADVRVTLQSAPRIANELVNAGISIAYYNAAAIPDLNGNPWTTSSPNVLDETAIANGGLYTTSTTCPQRKFDVFVTPHNGGYSYSLSDPTDLGTRAYSQLDTFVHDGGGWTALCHSILSNENNINNLTRNGTPAVKNLFYASRPGGVPGGFLTTNGFPSIANGGGTWTVQPSSASLPVIQGVPTTGASQSLPGGSVQTWPAPGNPGAPTYYAQTESIAGFDNPGVDYDHIIAGTYHNATGAGKVTFIGGHSLSTGLPYSTNGQAPYLRAFYNSLFFNGSAVAKLDLRLTPANFPQNGTGLLSASVVNVGASKAVGLGTATLTLQPGFTYVSTTTGPTPTVTGIPATGQTLTWASLGDIDGGQTAVTVQVSVDPSVTSTLGHKQFGQFHILYGDEFGEGFTADLCRDVVIVPQPAPKLTKTPASQGPVSTGQSVTWTLAYGNTGAAALQSTVLQDTLPPGFVYLSSSVAPTVIPGSQTILRWNLGTIAATTPSAGTITVTARAGSASAPQQTFTNNAALRGTDAGGTPYSQTASADVIVQPPSLSLGKAVDKSVTTLPDATGLTYTLTPGTADNSPLSALRVFDTVPTGATAPPATVGQGGAYGVYTPIAAVAGNDPGPPVLDTALSVSTNVLQQPNTLTVTLNVKSSTAQTGVSPGTIDASGNVTCGAPSPASQNVPAGGAGVNFTWTCSLDDLGEYTFDDDASNGTVDWPAATSASVLSVETAGSNVITWNLGSNASETPGQVLISGQTAGVFALPGNNTTTFDKFDIATNAWAAKAVVPTAVKAGGALAADTTGGVIYALRGNNQKNFYKYDPVGNSWSALTNTTVNVTSGGAAVFLGGNVYATMGNSTAFYRWAGPGAGSWTAMAAAPASFNGGAALTTDGTNIYALLGNNTTTFYRYNVAANTWTTLATTPAAVQWGGALVYASPYIYATRGNGQKTFWRYSIGGNSWTAMTASSVAFKSGGALATDGTSIWGLAGNNTKTFVRYSIAANTWTTLTSFPVNVNQGGALAYLPAVSANGRYSEPDTSTALATPGQHVTVTMAFSADNAATNVVPSALTTTPVGGASCSTLTGPTLTSADTNIANINDPVVYTWDCTVAAGANVGESLTFAASATANGGLTWNAATSQSVIVSPLLTFRVALPGGAPTIVKNTGIIAASGVSAISPTVTTATGSPVLTITKSNSPTSSTVMVPGDPITYTMVVENSGAGNATSVTATDAVPANTTYVTCTGGASCNQAAGTVTWNIGTLAPGATSTITYTVATASTAAVSDTDYTISNTASVSSTQTAPVSSNTVTNTLRVKPTIVKSVSETEGQTGDLLTYTLNVSNPGGAFTGDITDTLPAGVSFTGVGSCAPACTFSGGAVRWNGAAIAAGTNTFSFTATITAGGGTTIVNSSVLDPTAPNLAAITSNSVQTEVGPMLDLVKFVSPIGQVNAGDTLTYTVDLINSSNVTATGVVVTDPVPAYTNYVSSSCTTPQGTCSLVSGVVTWTYGNLPAGAFVPLTFQVTVGTLPGGVFQVFNVAHATATNMTGTEDSNPVGNPTPTPTFSLGKSVSPSTYSHAGDVLNYTYSVTNNDNTTTVNGPITVTDDKTTASCPAGNIAPLATMTCTASYTVTQADVDAGSVTNTATAHAGATPSNSAQATATALQSPSIHVVKSSTTASVTAPGQVVPYTFTVTNTGNVTLTGITVADPKCNSAPAYVSGDANSDSKLQLAETWVYGCSHTVTQVEVDAGGNLSNTVTADSVESAPATSTLNIPVTQSPSIHVVKSSTTASVTAAGQVVPYTFTLTNTGNVTLTGITVSDPKCDSAPTLSSGDANADSKLQLAETWVYGCNHTVTQGEMDAGGNLSNTVTADSVESAPATSTLNIAIAQSPSIHVVKSSTTLAVLNAGQVIPYTFTVTNTGNVTLTGITVSDPKCGAAPTLSSGDTNSDSKLQLSETWVYTCSHTVTQAEVDAGGNLSNTVTADSVESAPATSTLNIPVSQTPAIHVVKSSTTASITVAGQAVPYTFTVTNTGNVTLTGITVSDPKCGAAPTLSSGDANSDSKLQLSETWVYTCSHTVTQAEVDAGGNLSNTVTADSVESAPATSTLNIPVVQGPAINVVKSSTTASVTAAGQVVPYTFTVTNTGNVTLTGITVADPKCNSAPAYVSGDANSDSKLQLAETWVYGCSHTVTQVEVDAGGNLSNTVTADSVESAPATSTLNIPVTQSPSIHVVKSSTTASVTAAGQVVPYTFTVTNTGNVTLTGITVADPKCGAAPALSSGDANSDAKLQLAEVWVYTCSHTVTQAEVDAGGNLSNTVTADSVESAPATSSLNIPIAQSPSIHVVKSSTALAVLNAGQVIPYTFTVTNNGNVTLSGITVSDPKCGAAPVLSSGDTNADSKLQLSETWVYTCSHTVTQGEVDAGGNLSNTVTADSVESAPATSTLNIPVSQTPAIHVVKSSTTASIGAAGQVVPYTFTVTNTGNVTLTGITVSDPKCGAAPTLSSGDANSDSKLQLSETWVYGCSHTVTQAEVDAGGNLSNTVTADSVESAPATSTLNIPVTQAPAINVVKSSTTASVGAAGQVVPYTFTVTNTGNVTLTGITVADPKCGAAPALSSGDANADSKLQLSETWVYTCNRTVTQAEVDAGGNLSNTVTADSVESAPATSTLNIPVTQSPSIHVVKSSTTAAIGAAGQVVPYTFTVTNTGNVTLTGTTVADPKCDSAPTLSSGDANADSKLQLAEVWVYTCNRTVTQAEVDAGGNLSNTVTADSVESAPATSTLNIPVAQTPSIHVVKSSTTASITAVGQVVPYTFTVTNTGNVTLTGITVADPKCGAAPALSSGDTNADSKLQLSETWVYTCSHTVTQAEVDAGGNVSNTVTADSVESAPATSTLNIPVTQSPSIHVIKSSTTASVTAAGQVVPYTFTLTNTGNVTLTGITVSDPKCNAPPTLSSGDANTDSKLQLAETWVYGCNHTVTQAEVDAGGNLSNTVTADSVESAPATSTLNIPVTQTPAIHVVKSSTTAFATGAGQVVPYRFTVTNTGNVTLTGITVSDPKCDSAPTLSSGDANTDSKLQLTETWILDCNHTVSQPEVDAGGNLSNTVTVDSVESAPATSTLNIPVTQSPSIHVVKSSTTASVTAAGQVVPYAFTVTNTGNVTLTGITVADPKCNAAPTLASGDANTDAKLQLAEAWVYTCSRTVTQAEVDAGGNLSNTVTADSVESAPATSTLNIPIAQSPALGLSKAGTLVMTVVPPPGQADAGDRIDYTLHATNTGNVTLHGVTIADPLIGALTCAQPATLAPGASLICTGSYTLTAADVTAGQVANTAQVDGLDPGNNPVTASASKTVPLVSTPSLAIAKHASPTTYDHVGQVIDYSYDVTDDGNTIILGPFSVADNKTTDEACPPTGSLSPGGTITCTSSYTITQADLDAGSVTNIASATNGSVTSPTDTVTVTALQSPQLTLAKVGAVDMTVVAPPGRVDAGDKVNYTLTATNAGNVTLHAVTIADPLLGALTCVQPVTLAPGGTLVCTGSYTVTQANIDAGHVDNTATADSTETPPVSTPRTVALPQAKTLQVQKSVVETSYSLPGDLLHYHYLVTNTGNTSLAGPVTVSDTKTPVSCPAVTTVGDGDTDLDPGEALDCTATYTVTPADVTAGSVSNTAHADAGGVQSPDDSVTVLQVPHVADLAVTKTSAPAPYVAGNPLTYTVRVTNNGPDAVAGAAVTDTVPAAITGVTWTCAITTGAGACGSGAGAGNALSTTVDLASGAVATFTVVGTVNPATTGVISNTATAVTPLGVVDPTPANNTATDLSAPTAQADAAIAIAPTTASVAPSAPLSFTVTVSNNGPASATGVQAAVTLPPGYGYGSASGTGWTCALVVSVVTCDRAAPLAFGATASPIALNVVAPAGAGHTTLNATVTTTSPDTNPANDTAAASVDVTAPPPGNPQADLSVVKTGPATATTGGQIAYTIAVSNNGPDAAQNLVLVDALPAGLTLVSANGAGWLCSAAGAVVTCTMPSLASGASAPVQVVVTASTAGSLVNSASISSSTADPSPGNNTSTATTSVTARADLAVTKKALSKTFVPGQTLTFTVTVANHGPDDVSGARVHDVVPAALTGVTWTCAAVSGSCAPSGSGSIDQPVDIAAGGQVVFTVAGTPKTGAPAKLSNTASVTLPANVTDPNLANNSATAAVPRGLAATLLRVLITPKVATLRSGVPVKETVTTTNIGTATAKTVITCVALPAGVTIAQASGGFPANGSYCWRTSTLAPQGKVTFRFMVRGDRQQVAKVKLVAVAQAVNAPRVNDHSKLVVVKGTSGGVWVVFTG